MYVENQQELQTKAERPQGRIFHILILILLV